MMLKMRRVVGVWLFVVLITITMIFQVADSRWIKEEDPKAGRLFVATTETCEPTYGILPCSSNAWGLLFLIVVYELMLSYGGRFVATGSELFFGIIGPGVFGASLFQFLGTIPQIVLVLASALSSSDEAAQQRAKLGVGLVAGTAVMLLTLIWGTTVVLGSYDLSEAAADTDNINTESQKTALKGYGVVTDVETSFTARIILITMIPFLVILLGKAFHSSAGKRIIILIALIITVFLLFAYIFYQIFQPWIHDRRFEYLMHKYAKDKLLRLLSRNGKPDTRKIQELFSRIDKNKNASVSPAELRILLLGVEMDDDDDLSMERDVESIFKSFDTSGDGLINQDEFIQGMSKLVSDRSDQPRDFLKNRRGNKSQDNNQLQQGLLANQTSVARYRIPVNSWLNYLRAFFFVILGTAMLCALSEPLITSVVTFSQVANFSSFSISYLAIPFAMNYGVAVQSLNSARQKSKQSISLTLSALYGGVYMNNIIGLIVYLAPVYARNLSADVFSEILIVLVVCISMTVVASLRTTFPRWMGYAVLSLYPISLALIYLVTDVL